MNGQMIRTLQSREELTMSREELRKRGLDFTDPKRTQLWRFFYRLRFRQPAPDVDFIKSWDVANAARMIENAVPNTDTPILDMGCYNSEILYVLDAMGYGKLHGCDLNPLCTWMPYWSRIHYAVSDLTHTRYPDHFFGAITCLSVIEHGVPVEPLVKEVRRLLRPDGVFIVTTDYDATGHVHSLAKNLLVFGREWKIFTPEDVKDLISQFQRVGFSLLCPQTNEDTHSQCPIQWNGENYTFTLVYLKAPCA